MNVFIVLFFIHVLFFLSIFEIYFKSPIIDNIPVSVKAQGIQLAKRVVIFFADGVRSEKFYEVTDRNSSHSPYIRTLLANNEACGGIAHTQVPTETRPGAIAMLAGFYEDPSAIFKGWQDNPVEFDHIFNQSEFSVAFGSPDVLKMFTRGFKQNVKERMHFEFYDENEQQFNNEAQLNYWVGNKTIQYLRDNKDSAILNQDKVIFLLHFLGPDTAGHNFKPHSKEYGDNIETVDGIVKAMVHTLSSYYNHDNKTAFIYSSDHGMTDWGSHGDGSDHETETPFVAWGAGVGCIPYPPSSPSSFLPSSSGHLDIAQVDMVSLVSTILGIPIPVHSVGELPLQYLSLDTSQQARVMHSNAIQIHNAYRTLRSQRRESIARCLFTPFHKLDEQEEAVQLGRIELGFKLGDHQMVISQCKDLIRLSLEGLSYFHTYHQTTLLSCVSLAYLFIIRTLFLSVAQRTKISELTIRVTYRQLGVAFVMIVFCYNYGLPLQSYVFALLPIFAYDSLRIPDRNKISDTNINWIQIPFHAVGVVMLVFTFHHRWILSILLVCIALHHLYRYSMNMYNGRRIILGSMLSYSNLYAGSLLLLAVFPVLPIVGTRDPNNYLLVLAGISWLVYSKYRVGQEDWSTSSRVVNVQRCILGVTIVHIVLWSRSEPYRLQLLISWLILAISPLCILFSPVDPQMRLNSIGLGLAPPFILLCTSYEVLFLLLLFIHLICWYRIETSNTWSYQSSYKDLKSGNMEQGFLILAYLFLCFFGLGNIASVSSYNWTCVRFFLTVFSPFTMLSFVLLKIFIPFLLVSCVVRAIHMVQHSRCDSRGEAELVLQVVLGFCDMMGIVFLYQVRNTGSWKQIGLSISHVVIVHSITLALLCLYILASYLIPSARYKRNY